MNLARTYFDDLLSLIFPELCAACHASLVINEKVLCTHCLYNLPFTNFHQQPDNIVAQQFWGKLPVQYGYALLYFNKGGDVQRMMHHFKYDGMHRIGNVLGEIAGQQLAQTDVLRSVTHVIPVPLHSKRLRKRGYNQSECFAEGIAVKLNAVVSTQHLIRQVSTKTQTKKSRFARFQNMQQVFAVKKPEELANQHVLLVDDIVTTGSTLEACGAELLKIPGLKLSIAAAAYAV